MSRAPHEAIDVGDAGIGNDQYLPQSAPNEASHGMSNFVDGSGPIFSLYLEMATEEDEKMVENWKADADGILIFTGLFSAAVASLISVSIQDIRPNPVDTSNFYLKNIYHQTVSNTSSSLPASPPPFSPPNYAVWVNALWFLSLVISLTCALLATLLQQWARRYLKVTQPRYSPHKRARIRAFFFEGVEKCLLPWAVEVLPTLLHISLLLFFAGLTVYLCNVNLSIFKSVLSWVGVCTALYGCITVMPIFRHDSPYHTPLSLPAWHIVIGTSYIVFRVLRWFANFPYFSYDIWSRFRDLEEKYRRSLVQGMPKTAEETALNLPSEIDTCAFMWTFDSSDEDHELERFFAGLPGFRSSKVADDPLLGLTEGQKQKLSTALIGFLDRTFSSDLLPEPVKNRRAIIFAKALDPTEFPDAYGRVLFRIVFQDQYKGLQTAGFGGIVRGWGSGGNQRIASLAQATTSYILARAQRRDDPWFVLASGELGVPETVLRDYAAHGSSLSLAILIHITRQQLNHYWKGSWPSDGFSKVLEAASNFNVLDTSAELQHEFCALWNQIVLEVRNDKDQWMATLILGRIRNIYIALHRDTDAAPTRFSASTGNWDRILRDPSSYPVCNVAGHVHDDSASASIAPMAPATLASHNTCFSSVPTPIHVAKSPMDVPLHSYHPAHHQTTIETLRVSVTSSDPAIAGAIRYIVTSGITMPHSTPKTSTSAPRLPSTSPPAVISRQHSADLRTSFDTPNLQFLASPNPVLDNVLPTGPPLSSQSHMHMTRSDFSPSFPDSHRSMIVTTTPSAPHGPTSVPDLDTAAEDSGSLRPGLRKDEDALNTRSQLPLVTNSYVATTGPSLRGPNAERAGDRRSSFASFVWLAQYEIV